MYKRKICLLLIVVFLFLFKVDVNAAGTCTTDEKQYLTDMAYKIEIIPEVVAFENPHSADFNYVYNIMVNNLTEDFYLLVGNFEAQVDYDANNNVYEKIFIGGGYNGKIKVYSSNKTKCPNTLIRAFEVWIPYYNKYSERTECDEFKDYDICKVTTDTTNISEENFLSILNQIKQSQETPSPIVEEEKTFFDELIDFVNENKIVVISICISIVIFIVMLVVYVKKKRKNKIKINLEV